ncbi:hypothetical protein [Novosphingobium sp. JCM 18896]|uniref:hypothetical protein n=1 Tax=Novosphingobium sp. JCM 18896 TaxID=2989731 RepID=UPI002222DDA6|nr:hypothetical protein [Novosphingobium sp. JCM 18896]MCW1432459.1 hypothetical protein [Novosphingobium sp. JCM 18896]
MLIEVFSGRDIDSAEAKGAFHFAVAPKPGEQIERGAELLVVRRAWHRPKASYRDAKYAILAEGRVESQPCSMQRDVETLS